MALTGIRGSYANQELMMQCLRSPPALVIDCANCANIHEYSAFFPEKSFHEVFVVPAESLYRFRDTLRMIPRIASKLGVKKIAITSFSHLFGFDDEIENNNVYEYCWRYIQELSKHFDVNIGVTEAQYKYARKYCDKIQTTVNFKIMQSI